MSKIRVVAMAALVCGLVTMALGAGRVLH